MSLWPNQIRAFELLDAAMRPGARLCVTSPTGSGKSAIAAGLLERAKSAVLYTNRRMLLEQTSRVLTAHGIEHGIMAAKHLYEPSKPIQLCSIQTVESRVFRSHKWRLPDAELCIIDEAHVNSADMMARAVDQHLTQSSACIVGFTATPLNIGHFYDDLLVAGTVSECRKFGALVPAYYYAPDEPDMRKLRRTANGEYTTRDIVKAMMTHCIVGRVIENWRKLNPEEKPTLLFAPGKAESLWFAQELSKNGIPSAHIDGDSVWMNGQEYTSDREARDSVCAMLKSGEVKVVCNRFVMREGVDLPYVRHLIFATIFGALTSFLQSAGRGLRNDFDPDTIARYGPKTGCTFQDHGGNYYRHGSVNADREWSLEHTDYIVGEMREQAMREKKLKEPIRCPKCGAIRGLGAVCQGCGHGHTTNVRSVVQHDGKLREVAGDVYKPRRLDHRPEDQIIEAWKKIYYRCKNKGMTFNQARGLYQYENNWVSPPEGLPLMPTTPLDWFRPVNEVPADRLVGFRDAVDRYATTQKQAEPASLYG